ncbi:MAG: VWA domain-containing protein [Vicinamibacterales bacterium]|jgi:Ca-activated chloride channel family protein|nr:VWA domain-containing protein [Vicinamibacterales bacterium]
MRPYLMCPLALAMFASPLQAQPVFRSGVDLVHLGVTVVGKDGQPVSGLRAEDFVIQEEGREQGIAYFTRGLDNDLETMPLHLGVLFDTSGSMDRDAGFAKTAAIKFLRDLNFAVDMTLVSFDTEVRVSRFGQSDFPRLVERLRGQETGGMTALYDALGVYLDGAFAQDGRKVLLLYTDGGDTRSRMRLGELLDLVRASDVTVYAIGFQTQLRVADRMMERLRLEEIVGLTGGQCYFPDSVDELDEIYAQIRDELAARYSLGYVSTDPTTDGAWRRVTVTLAGARPELEGARIRARNGYFAPYFEDAPRDR